MDLQPFLDPDFNAVAYINQVSASVGPDDSLDRCAPGSRILARLLLLPARIPLLAGRLRQSSQVVFTSALCTPSA
jgi:hypothetical protein